MSLLEQQNFLARLYTDESLRKRFLSEPEKIGAENDLNEQEIIEIAAVLPQELNFFAESLVWKRLREVEKFLPLTRTALGDEFQNRFREFSNQFLPTAIKKHLEDALEFCEYLQNLNYFWEKDLISFEQARLKFNSGAENFVFRQFDYNIKEILEEISRIGAKRQREFKRKKSFAVWLRIGKRTRHFVF